MDNMDNNDNNTPSPQDPAENPQQPNIRQQENNNGFNTDTNTQSTAGGINRQAQTTQNPQYDSFMYEPIGFEEYDKQVAASMQAAEERKEKKRKSHNERTIILFLLLIFVFTVIFCIFAIIHDAAKSEKSFANGFSATKNVVLYHEGKPEGADTPENYKDENGRYTTEGIAATVRPSIVEIYTYADLQHNALIGTGSGVILSEDGYIVTNAHVLQADGYHVVITSDDKTFDAKVIGRDAKTDIAIVKINANGLKPATLGDSDEVVVGEQVMAIGNPAGLSGSVTDGIVSATGRKIKSDATGFEMECIQTNADISPGNSGGALVNMYGQLIGITSSKYVSSSYEGLGFAITINEAVPIMEELINQGYISDRFRIGIELLDMENDYKIAAIEEELGFEIPDDFEGIYIANISEDCDIYNTELKIGDFITAINGKSIKTYDELYDTISRQYGAGDKVPATCAHLNEDGTIDVYEIEFMLMEDTSGDF